MITLLLPALLLLAPVPVSQPEEVPTEAVQADAPPQFPAQPQPQAPPQAAAPSQQPAAKDLKPLSFFSQRFTFRWDQLIPLTVDVDGLRINSIYFNKRTLTLFKSAEFGTRAVVAVTNTASTTRTPGFAVAVFDAENRLLGVASGGPKVGGIPAGDTQTFDMSFHQVIERIPRGDHFVFTVELTN
jgi:hypothetical protein